MSTKALTPAEIVALIREEQKKKTEKNYLKLKISREETTVFDSKFGGTPYLPEGFEYPCNLNNEYHKPLKLLAQLNFAQLPHLEGFPKQGILQFYIPYEKTDDVFGLDFDDPVTQKGFRVIYHETVTEDESRLQSPPELEDAEAYFPFSGCFKVTGEIEKMTVSSSDYQFEKMVLEFWNQYAEKPLQNLYELDEDLLDELLGHNNEDDEGDLAYGTHLVGGYPSFTQSDPREYIEEYRKFDTVLLQIDSDGNGDDEILWGDCGIANFFISSENLQKKDFSEVLYNWDCC